MTNNKKGLVEEAMRLKTGNFGKGLIKMAKSGELMLNGPYGTALIDYRVDPEQSPLILEMEYCLKESDRVVRQSQTVELALKEATYGTAWLFRCRCGRLASILYLPRNKSKFLCRKCHNLTYEICRLNPNTMDGLFTYSNRLQRLMEKQEDIGRLFYRNRFTRKARSLHRWRERWGFGVPEEVKRLAELQIKLNG